MPYPLSVGISTATLYPELTENAVKWLTENHVSTIEIFFNTLSELSPAFLKEIKNMLRAGGVRVCSIHPFSSFAESFMFFTAYERRFRDILDLYKRYYFTAMQELGAEILVFHGDSIKNDHPAERYFERFAALYMAGKEAGITVAQENVCYCKSGSPDFIRSMRAAFSNQVQFVLDTKQAVRFGVSPSEMVDAMGNCIAHIHLSDHTPDQDCLPPGQGCMDFQSFFSKLRQIEYHGSLMIELYRQNYREYTELLDSLYFVEQQLQSL